MCGIVGYIGKDKCIPKIINGLESLEYRGYDSSGIAYMIDDKILIEKACGKIDNLKRNINLEEDSYLGIGHTRWATHGEPSKINSHPHNIGKVTIVHNGIIENYESLKLELKAKNYTFVSETDTEVVAALIDYLYKEENNMLRVLNKLKEYLVGSYALGIIVEDLEKIYAIRKDSPLIIGISNSGNFIASDVPAILKYTDKYYLLDDYEYAVLEKDKVAIYNDDKEIEKNLNIFNGNLNSVVKDGYEHFMLKEIYEQPKVIMDTINEYLIDGNKLDEKLKGLEEYTAIDIVGCGSSYHAGLVFESLITEYGNILVNTYVASEYRYKKHIYSNKHLIILISQSGETADTLAVIRKAKKDNIDTLAIVNVIGSSIAREADKVIYTKAGPEISVATTKAYSCQVMILSLIAIYLGIKNNKIDLSEINKLKETSNYINNILKDTSIHEEIAKLIYDKKDIFFIGRKIDYSLCMEASLKLKEISYIHSDAYQAGELKHGTISLIENNTPVISIITDSSIRLKTLSNIKEVAARGALNILITNKEIEDKELFKKVIVVSNLSEFILPILVIINCQLISYYVAKLNGCDIDKPRNLAKSVTVE